MAAVDFLQRTQSSHVIANFNANNYTLGISMIPSAGGKTPYFSLELLNELHVFFENMKDQGIAWVANGMMQPVHYMVLKSAHPDYFSLGGDLNHFRNCIHRQDKRALRDYSMLCLSMMYELSTVLGQQLTTVSLVQGRALGGGFETALAADYLIAEEQSEFGFPEILFGLFPCTGGMSLLARRIGPYKAERMMTNARIYKASELLEMGIVDEVCPRGQGEVTVEKFIAGHSKHRRARLMLQRGRHRLSLLDYEELKTVVDEWVETAINLGKDDLRVMDMLIRMQRDSLPGGSG